MIDWSASIVKGPLIKDYRLSKIEWPKAVKDKIISTDEGNTDYLYKNNINDKISLVNNFLIFFFKLKQEIYKQNMIYLSQFSKKNYISLNLLLHLVTRELERNHCELNILSVKWNVDEVFTVFNND